MKSSPSSISGFTLTELLVVITVAGILATIAIPSFKSLSQSQRVKNASFELYSSLSLARSEAIKRNNDVTMTPVAYSVTSPAPTHNEFGWTIAANNVPIRNLPQMKGIAITANGLNNSGGITYQRTGRATTTPIILIDAYGTTTPYASCVKIELSGMPRIYKPVNGAC